MSREIIDGVWIIKCDFVGPEGSLCDLGVDGDPAMFVDPTDGKDSDKNFQCGHHHGIFKQEDDPDFQLPEGHKLEDRETVLLKNENYTAADKVELDGFVPDAGGRVWDGNNVKR